MHLRTRTCLHSKELLDDYTTKLSSFESKLEEQLSASDFHPDWSIVRVLGSAWECLGVLGVLLIWHAGLRKSRC